MTGSSFLKEFISRVMVKVWYLLLIAGCFGFIRAQDVETRSAPVESVSPPHLLLLFSLNYRKLIKVLKSLLINC